MKCVYETKFARQCPVNGAVDFYDLIVEAERHVQVEAILIAIDELPDVAFQEDLTELLATKLGCSVTTIGYHSGVKTTCNA